MENKESILKKKLSAKGMFWAGTVIILISFLFENEVGTIISKFGGLAIFISLVIFLQNKLGKKDEIVDKKSIFSSKISRAYFVYLFTVLALFIILFIVLNFFL